MAKEDIYYYCDNNPDYVPGWDWITESIAIGSYPLEPEFSELLDSGFTAILSVRGEEPDYDGARFAEAHVAFAEDFVPFPDDELEEALRFMHRVLSDGRKVYVHCFAGKSRSAFVVSCYLMLSEGIPFEEAVRRVQSARSVCRPQPGLYSEGALERVLANREKILGLSPVGVA